MMQSGKEFTLVDALSSEHFDKEHIRGAVSLPSTEVGARAEGVLDRGDTIVVYCAGPSCQASDIAAEKLEAMGFPNVFHYAGGIEQWKQAQLPMEGDAVEAEHRV
ncbi:MAG: rhodanese-like domain-containing protein [Chitinivibrionales bacterium]|nr:rhodanese-like domain-containing protein [Chitinivibrionales bacterium]